MKPNEDPILSITDALNFLIDYRENCNSRIAQMALDDGISYICWALEKENELNKEVKK